VPNIGLKDRDGAARLHERIGLRMSLDRLRREIDQGGNMQAHDRFEAQAWNVLTGSAARRAFDIAGDKEAALATATKALERDPQNALVLRSLTDAVADERIRGLVEWALDRFEEVVVAAWPTVRMQVIHSDLSADNALVDDRGMITGIVDFGQVARDLQVVEAVVVGHAGRAAGPAGHRAAAAHHLVKDRIAVRMMRLDISSVRDRSE
jgi:hypothetical protein